MAEDQVIGTEIEEFDWEDIGSNTQFQGPPPFLGVVIVDELRPSSGEYAKSANYWELDVLDVRSPVKFVHRNRVNVSAQKKSKLGLITANLRKLKTKFRVAAAQSKKNPGPSELIGVVGWFEKNDEDLKFGQQTYPYTKALRKATTEETIEAQAIFENYVPEARADGVEASPVAPVFEWTPERIEMSVGLLVGEDAQSKIRAARKLPADEQVLRNAITSGEAERYLTENGYLAMNEVGVYVRTE